MAKKIIIWGAGGHALVVADALRSNGEAVFGFIDTVSFVRKDAQLMDLPVWGSVHEAVTSCQEDGCEIAFGFGHCAARSQGIKYLDRSGISLKTVVHARAYVSPAASLGRGIYVAPNAVVEPGCSIGDGVIVNAGSVVCHESSIGQAVSICPGVCIGGKAKVGEASWLGIGCTLIDKVCVGTGCFIGGGAVVIKGIPDRSLAYGVPARVVGQAVAEF